MKKLFWVMAMTVASMFTQAEMRMGTGGSGGNYYQMAQDVGMYCPDAAINVMETGGSIDNITGMGAKQYHMGWIQEDVLRYFAKSDPGRVNENGMKVIMDGHMETIHILIPKGWEPESTGGGWFSGLFSADEPQGVSLDLLKGQTIGSWGGSLVSAKALSDFGGFGMNIVELTDGQRNAPNIPILLVGGQPYRLVQDYLNTGRYTLIGINAQSVGTLPGFYNQVNANYSVGGKLQSIPTFGVKALIMGKAFRSAARNQPMADLANCINESLIDLADDPDTSPMWGSVFEMNESGDQVEWDYFPMN